MLSMKSFPPADSATLVLIVDEASPFRETLESMLRSEGFLVHLAADRHQAAALVRDHAIDLVLMNMLMPHAEGIGTIIAVRSLRPEIRIIAMSAGDGEAADHFLPLAKSLGASALLRDPLDREKLIDAIRTQLGEGLRQMAS